MKIILQATEKQVLEKDIKYYKDAIKAYQLHIQDLESKLNNLDK